VASTAGPVHAAPGLEAQRREVYIHTPNEAKGNQAGIVADQVRDLLRGVGRESQFRQRIA
jgi:type IV pilus biogenesis protein CpaD/CtpE